MAGRIFPTGRVPQWVVVGLATVACALALTAGGCGSSGNGTPTPPPPQTTAFDGSRAFTLLQAQCNFGPRPMGTAAHQQLLQWIVQQLTPLVDTTPIQQSSSYTSRHSGQTFTVTNVIGFINPDAPRRIMIAAHWDTRPVADSDPNPANWSKPILGADDGASGIAVLLELARIFHATRPTVGVEFVFLDGEDFAAAPGLFDEMYLGAIYLASHLTDPVSGRSLRPTYGVLLDMIGDKNLNIPEEINSLNEAPSTVSTVWNAAAAIGDAPYFLAEPGYQIVDDHIPLLAAGIPVIDCIDFDFESRTDLSHQYWHTLQDTPDKCSAASLQVVGNVMAHLVYGETAG